MRFLFSLRLPGAEIIRIRSSHLRWWPRRLRRSSTLAAESLTRRASRLSACRHMQRMAQLAKEFSAPDLPHACPKLIARPCLTPDCFMIRLIRSSLRPNRSSNQMLAKRRVRIGPHLSPSVYRSLSHFELRKMNRQRTMRAISRLRGHTKPVCGSGFGQFNRIPHADWNHSHSSLS